MHILLYLVCFLLLFSFHITILVTNITTFSFVFIFHRVLNLVLSHVECDVALRGLLCDTSKVILRQVLCSFHVLWLEYFEEKTRKEEEESSLYKFRVKSHCVDSDESAKNERSFVSFFPSFDKDYHDVMPRDSLNDDEDNTEVTDSTSSFNESSTKEMAHIDVCFVFNSLKAILSDRSQLKDAALEGIFLSSYREFCALSSMAIIKNGELLFPLQCFALFMYLTVSYFSVCQSHIFQIEIFLNWFGFVMKK